MTLEQLKALYKEGKISKEQYESLAKAIDENFVFESDEEEEGSDPASTDVLTPEDIEKLTQQAIDRATNRLGNENKRLKQELERIKREKMSDEERKKSDLDDKAKELEAKEAELLEKENRLYALKAIKVAGLDDGSDKSFELVDFVIDTDTETIDSKIKAFGDLVKKFVKAEVDKTFKESGRTPSKGGGSAGAVNPYSKATFNLTEQMRIESENPELAKQLKAAAQ